LLEPAASGRFLRLRTGELGDLQVADPRWMSMASRPRRVLHGSSGSGSTPASLQADYPIAGDELQVSMP